MKKLLISVVALLALCSSAFSQLGVMGKSGYVYDYLLWEDSHSLINYELALSTGIEDKFTLEQWAVDDFEKMKKLGIVNGWLCKLYHIDDHVDFIMYVRGAWDIDHSTTSAGSEKARNEEACDYEFSNAVVRLQTWLYSNPTWLQNDLEYRAEIINLIKEEIDIMTSANIIRCCSPSVRITLPGYVKQAQVFLSKWKMQ